MNDDPVLRMDGGSIKDELGGNLTSLTNFCCVRMSHALTQAGHPITIASDFVDDAGNGYIIRVKTMKQYLRDTLGQPTLVSKSSAKGMKGIILFNISFSDATGHVDLWDGSSCAFHEYWDGSTSVELFPLD